MRPSAILVPALLFSVTACDDGQLGVLLPQVAIDACGQGVIEVAGETLGGTSDCAVDFGAVPLGPPRRLEVQVSNPSNVALRVDAVSLGAETDPAFFVESFPPEVPASTSVPLVVWFRPVVQEQVSGSITIVTDGDNAPAGGITVNLSGTGADAVGALTVAPAACDFGLKTPGSTSRCDISLDSRGASTTIFSAEVTGDAFALDGAVPTEVAVTATSTITVLFNPLALESYSGTLVLETSDPAASVVEVPLSGAGTDGPACEVLIAGVNGAPPGDSPVLRPLDDVNFTITSTSPDAITTWAFLEKPPGSQLGFEPVVADETRLFFDETNFGIDVAGVYRLQAFQTDPVALTAGSCEFTFTAVPDQELLIQLSWDTPEGDLDLHVVRQDDAGRYCARGVDRGDHTESCGDDVVEDCYYYTCRPDAEQSPDWAEDGATSSAADPRLDVDDLCGFGPENINVDSPTAGRYLVGVDHYGFTGCDGDGSSFATLRVYVYGHLVAEHIKEMQPGEFWEAIVIDWPAVAGQACIEDLATPFDDCP